MMGLPQGGRAGEPGDSGRMGFTKRFSPENLGFHLGTQVVNSILQHWPLVCGTGSLLEAHLVGRLALASDLLTLVACGINEL